MEIALGICCIVGAIMIIGGIGGCLLGLLCSSIYVGFKMSYKANVRKTLSAKTKKSLAEEKRTGVDSVKLDGSSITIEYLSPEED